MKTAVPLFAISEQDRAELTRLEEDMWREATRYDRMFQEKRFAADFVEFGLSGRVYARQEIIRTNGQPIHAVLPLPNLSIRLLDENTAQVTYNSQVTYDGVVEHGRRSSIWSRTSIGWVMRFHQGHSVSAVIIDRVWLGSRTNGSVSGIVPNQRLETDLRAR